MIFVDTGALIGRHLRDDQHHSDAVPLWGDLFRARARFVTSNFILDETFTLLARRGGYRFAAERAHGIRRAFSFDRHFRDAGFESIPAF